MNIVIYTDGGARGNPGPAAIGVVIEEQITKIERKKIVEFGKRIGETTNNVAEYTAVIEALSWLVAGDGLRVTGDEKKDLIVQFILDSVLVVNQLNGLFKVKDAKLRELLSRVRILEQEIGGSIHYIAVPREQNHRADALVNQALDNLLSPHVV